MPWLFPLPGVQLPSVLLPSVLWHCWLGGRKGNRLVKNEGWWRWALVSLEWRLAGWLVCLPLLIFPCTIKSRSSVPAPASPGGPGKRAIKQLWCDGVQLARVILTPSVINYGLQTLTAHHLPFQLLPNHTVGWQKHRVRMTCPKLIQSKLHH